MKTKTIVRLIALLGLLSGIVTAAPLGTAFTYQGRLAVGTNVANGSYNLKFTLYDATTSGTLVSGPVTNSATGVTNGLFTTTLDFGSGIFTGEARWLDIAVRTNGGSAFTPLAPRQPLTPAPYALFAPSAGAATTAGSASAVAANGVANAGLQANAVTTDKIADGTLTAADLSPALASNTFWRLGGNTGTTPGTQFLGTTDNQPVELKANARRALRLEPDPVNDAPNLIAGSSSNTVAPGVVGAVIAGGGRGTQPNRVFGAWGVISGGELNVASNSYDVVSGGLANTASGGMSTVGGGSGNVARDLPLGRATVAGGMDNRAVGSAATVGGGQDNAATNQYATVPGGRNNLAGGSDSLAAGRRAKALHSGTLAWADATDADFASTGANQFLIRASGGVGIGTNNPQTALHVAGTVTATGFSGSGAGLTGLNASQLASGAVPDARLSANVSLLGGSIESGEITDGTLTAADVQANTFWKNTGNSSTTPGTHFLGTTDNQPLELKVNNLRGLRLEPTITDANHSNIINVVAGSPVNSVVAGFFGATIAGGGAGNEFGVAYPNTVAASYGTISGGAGNAIQANAWGSVIGGGGLNTVQGNATYSAIGGGGRNTIQTTAIYATIGGGQLNTVQTNASNATIAGGWLNTIQTDAFIATIGGGYGNMIQTTAYHATIAGGYENTIQAGANDATIAGGYINTIECDADYGTIGGGYWNRIQTNASSATIGGGDFNTIQTNASSATIGGGFDNTIQPNARYATISGGEENTIQTNAFDGTIAGGTANMIQTDTYNATIGGGSVNTIQANALSSTIGGGRLNTTQANGDYATIPGGYANSATNYALAAGRRAKANHTGAFVWADSTDADFASSGNNQFLIRASGGVGLNENSPDSVLNIRRTTDQGGSLRLGANSTTAGVTRILRFGDGDYCSIQESTVDDDDMVILAENLGIGRTPTTYKLEVEGDASKTTAGNWSANSDRRIKTDILTVTNALETLAQVRLVSFRYADDYRAQHPSVQDRRYVNVVAQEFRAVFPDDVKSTGDTLPDGEPILAVDTYPLTIYSAAAIQELNQKLAEELKQKGTEITELRQELAELKRMLVKLSAKGN